MVNEYTILGKNGSLMQKDIEEIINTKKGKINYDFWRKIIMETKEKIMERKGCLMPKEVEKDIIKGWIWVFIHI